LTPQLRSVRRCDRYRAGGAARSRKDTTSAGGRRQWLLAIDRLYAPTLGIATMSPSRTCGSATSVAHRSSPSLMAPAIVDVRSEAASAARQTIGWYGIS